MNATVMDPQPLDVLTLHDRCDACGVAAQYRLTRMSTGSLDLCGHHYFKNSVVMLAQGWQVTGTA